MLTQFYSYKVTRVQYLFDISEIVKEEMDGNVIIKPDENTMKFKMDVGVSVNFDLDNSIGYFKKCIWQEYI